MSKGLLIPCSYTELSFLAKTFVTKRLETKGAQGGGGVRAWAFKVLLSSLPLLFKNENMAFPHIDYCN